VPAQRAQLWPYSLVASIVAAVVIWLSMTVLFFASRTYLQWPPAESETPLIFFSIGLSVIPIVMVLLDYVAARGGVIGSKWVKLDFSRTVAESGAARREQVELTDNILTEQENLYDSGGSRFRTALKRVTTVEVALIDLKDGNAWWVTRLLAVCATAARADMPRIIVFVGRKANQDRRYLGCGVPRALLEAILDANPEYRAKYLKASTIARQLALLGPSGSDLQFQIDVSQLRGPLALTPPPSGTAPSTTAFLNMQTFPSARLEEYDENEAAMLSNVLIKELRDTTPDPPNVPGKDLENPPDRLTLSRLEQLFEPYLYRDSIDRSWDNKTQLDHFLKSPAPYVAIAREGRYEAMLRSDLGERAVIRMLLAQSTGALHGAAGVAEADR
jgi:hypothetical protein